MGNARKFTDEEREYDKFQAKVNFFRQQVEVNRDRLNTIKENLDWLFQQEQSEVVCQKIIKYINLQSEIEADTEKYRCLWKDFLYQHDFDNKFKENLATLELIKEKDAEIERLRALLEKNNVG